MTFSISSWLHRKRVQAEVRFSGRTVQAYRVTNPYHGVSIKAGPGCHQTAQKYGSRRFLAGEVPPLPAPTCSVEACECRYVHHEDRRDKYDRRQSDIWDASARLAMGGGDRRGSQGRRATDH
jgi:hypothetical protein